MINDLVKMITVFNSGAECIELYKGIDTDSELELYLNSCYDGFRNENYCLKEFKDYKVYINPKELGK